MEITCSALWIVGNSILNQVNRTRYALWNGHITDIQEKEHLYVFIKFCVFVQYINIQPLYIVFYKLYSCISALSIKVPKKWTSKILMPSFLIWRKI